MNAAIVCFAIALLALAIVLLPRARPRAGPLDKAAATAIVDLSKSLVDSEATMLTNRLREQGNLLGTNLENARDFAIDARDALWVVCSFVYYTAP